MPSDQTALLRILSTLDQSLAKIESIIEREQTYDGWQLMLIATTLVAVVPGAMAAAIQWWATPRAFSCAIGWAA